MTPTLILLLAAIVGTLLLHRRWPNALVKLALTLELLLSVFLLYQAAQPKDITRAYQNVFRGSGYALGRVLRESGHAPGPVLVIVAGEGNVDGWRKDGLAEAFDGTGFTVAGVETVPVDLQSGNFTQDRFLAALAAHPGTPYAAVFGGLPGSPDSKPAPLFVCFHPQGTGGMQAWWKSGRLLGVIAPRMGDAPTPEGREKLAGLADSFFHVRHSREGM